MTYFETTYTGQIVQDGRAATCPRCRHTTGLTICGRAGGVGSLRCRCGRTFAFPAGFDARQRLAQAIGDSRRTH
ncbi:hypothetical protein [Streptomyces sp. NPDC056883]|uniref:hypothetical protein n=1 Tax=Streptomyces sp. NPDC056883 TaxID=3345959 RepID=UPI0036AB34EF